MVRTASLVAILLVAGGAGAWPWSRKPPPEVTVAAAGDIMLDRKVARAMARRGHDGMVVRICDLVSAADLGIANLECPLAEKSDRLGKPIAFRGSPAAVRCLVEGGFDVVNLANNHAVDCGRDGLRETMTVLTNAGMRWCGAGTDRREAEKPVILSVRGRRVAFVGFCEFLEGSRKYDNTPTIALAEEDTVRRVVAEAHEAADSVVASFHWGEEYEERPNRFQRRMAAAAVSSGADLVLGHHPHVLQGFELMSRTPAGRPGFALVAYSLGNFIFDQNRPHTRESVLLRVTLGARGVSAATLAAVTLDGYRPRPATAAERKTCLSKIERLSRALRTKVKGGEVVFPPG